MRIISFLVLIFLTGCNIRNREAKYITKDETIILLPLGNIPDETTKGILKKLQYHFPKVHLLKKEAFPQFAWYEPRNRYRADSILKWLQQRAGHRERYIAITTHDISTKKGAMIDYGVMGLAYRPGKACVASSYRLKDKTNFYKVVIHELAHTNGLPHCSNKNCYLRNAKGGDHTSDEKSFCNNCEATLKERGWQF